MTYRILIADKVNPSFEFDFDSFRDGYIGLDTAVDVAGSELAIDELTVSVDHESDAYIWFSPADYDGVQTSDGYIFAASDKSADLRAVEYGTPVWLYEDEKIVSKMYVKKIVRTSARTYKLYLMSAIGLLENQRHMGGLWTNTLVSAVLSNIVGGAFPCTVDPAVASEYISGWLPIDTRRANLHRLMFAMGISITKDEDGEVKFVYISDSDGKELPPERIFVGNSIDYESPASAIEVVEHSYGISGSAEEEEIFSSDGNVSAVLVEFANPMHSLRGSGLTINSSGVNFAVVTGNGTLYGIQYRHQTRTIRKEVITTREPNVITSSDDGLVNALNSENVAQRLLSYYTSRKTSKMTVVLDGEKAGDMVTFTDAEGEAAKGIITKADIKITSFQKAELSVVEDYIPTYHGNYYSHRVVIDISGTWSVPTGVTRIRIVLIGGGSGGSGGYDGENGEVAPDFVQYLAPIYYERGYINTAQGVASGGAAGTPGDPGKVYVVDGSVVPLEQLTVSVGSAGVGGAKNGGAGTSGTETEVSSSSLGALSSADGEAVDGYGDPITGDVYARPGAAGYAGGDGGQTDAVSLRGSNGANGLAGGNVVSFAGGAGGAGRAGTDPNGFMFRVSGGGGGGAAYGNDGSAGSAGTVNQAGFPSSGGSGGDGGDAVKPDTPSYGSGGSGGNGGGGGGNGAGIYGQPSSIAAGSAGSGGSGSAGGDAGAGCVIIYY